MITHRFKVLLAWDPAAQAWVTYVSALDYPSTFGETREEAQENTCSKQRPAFALVSGRWPG